MMVKVFDQDYGSSDDLLIETSWSGWATAVSGQTETLHDERHTDDDEWAAYYVNVAAIDLTPTSSPSSVPMPAPTTSVPVPAPTVRPTSHPTPRPTQRPTPRPTARPTPRPTARPTPRPSFLPTAAPLESSQNGNKSNTLAIVLPIILIVGAVSMAGALWMWRKGHCGSEPQDAWSRYRYQVQNDGESESRSDPKGLREMTIIPSSVPGQDPSYVALEGDDEEESEEATF